MSGLQIHSLSDSFFVVVTSVVAYKLYFQVIMAMGGTVPPTLPGTPAAPTVVTGASTSAGPGKKSQSELKVF